MEGNEQTPEGAENQNAVHVLLLDDEAGIVRATKRVLRIMGCRCTAFTRPSEAIAWYRENWNSVDLVILDMALPEMDGAETFAVLKSIHSETRAIIATGHGDHSSLERAREAGLIDSISKPFTQSDLATLLDTHVKSKRS